MGSGAGARLWVVGAAIDEHGDQAGLAGGVELVNHVGEEQDVGRSTADGAGNPPLAGRLALGPGLGPPVSPATAPSQRRTSGSPPCAATKPGSARRAYGNSASLTNLIELVVPSMSVRPRDVATQPAWPPS